MLKKIKTVSSICKSRCLRFQKSPPISKFIIFRCKFRNISLSSFSAWNFYQGNNTVGFHFPYFSTWRIFEASAFAVIIFSFALSYLPKSVLHRVKRPLSLWQQRKRRRKLNLNKINALLSSPTQFLLLFSILFRPVIISFTLFLLFCSFSTLHF